MILLKRLSILILLSLFSSTFGVNDHYNLTGIELPNHSSFNAVSSSSSESDCMLKTSQKHHVHEEKQSVKFHLKRRATSHDTRAKESVVESRLRDFTRIQTLQTRIIEKKNQNYGYRSENNGARKLLEKKTEVYEQQLMATLESGVSLGSGEYFMDVFVGTPPKHFSLILDTGSDLNWIQCVPCYDCFEQNGPHYNPVHSSSYENIGCHDTRCGLVTSPYGSGSQPCQKAENQNHTQSCPYFYWYGDSSNTTGDFALETFTVNLTTSSTGKSEFKKIENVMFGCGHWNRGLFHGAAGLLGLGRGPLSFSSQLQSLHGHSFSYCLVDRNSDASVSSKLIFGEDKELLRRSDLNFTAFVSGKKNQVDTFYYVGVKSIFVGGDALDIPEEAWNVSSDGSGGTIIDSGTTLSYFAEPAYRIIKEAFIKRVKKYPMVTNFPILNPCYNVSGLQNFELPEFGILFRDGAVWNFPVENYFIRLEPEGVVCLAMLGTPRSALSIIGNYQQQNFHILYDTKMSRLGFAPTRCADV